MSIKNFYLCAVFIAVPAMFLLFPGGHAFGSIVEGMVLIPEGTFLMGSSSESKDPSPDELPAHKVHLPAFYIDQFEVTNAGYKKFVIAKQHKVPRHWVGHSYPEGEGDHPVYNVSWEDAVEFCEFARKRLPTEAEWEKAARGPDGRIYPWGNQFEPDKARTIEKGDGRSTVPVDRFDSGKSPYGVYDMAGNVWEWTSDYYQPYDQKISKPNEYYGKKFRVIRGGSAHFNSHSARVTNRNIMFPSYRYFLVGFRCASSTKE